MNNFLPLLIILLVITAAARDDFALTLVYLFIGAYFAGAWWSKRALHQVEISHQMNAHAFLGEQIEVEVKLRNRGWLPVLWTRVQDSLPVALSTTSTVERVTGLKSYGEMSFVFQLDARKRGYYPVGPLTVSTGDVLGLSDPVVSTNAARYVTVYPKIVPLTSVKIPSRAPQGTLPHSQPIFEDPTRVLGKRDYVAGDSLRRVDWKSTATTGRMQVKLFEPSIALETMIFLNLNAEDYLLRHRFDSTELAVVIAASLATWIVGKKQTVGLTVNGADPLSRAAPQLLPPRKGQAHLIRMLEVLARVEMSAGQSFAQMIQRQRYQLAWGTTLIVITGEAHDDLLGELYQARRAGQNVLLILAGLVLHEKEIVHKAGYYSIPVISIPTERALDQWRK